jgi:hypothetical protein
MPEIVLSRLARSTEFSKTESPDPPERRRIQSGQAHTSANLTVLETLQTYRAAQQTVNACKSQNFHCFFTMGISGQRTAP